jgi:predicted DNA repair protein MutK
MASGFFGIVDDIGALMEDVVVMSKITTKKTASILGDDLAVTSEKASGFDSSRELPVLWAITKGSFLNKLIILPIAFLLSAFLPWSIQYILMLGGVYLAYEAAEKIYEFFIPHSNKNQESNEDKDSQTQEKKKIKSAILTDFILSIEIVIIALGSVIEQTLLMQIIVVSLVSILATIGVYGIVALIVRMDDVGYKLMGLNDNKKSLVNRVGALLIKALPKVIKSLGVIGTLALLMVSGGIFLHNIEFLHHFFSAWPSLLSEMLIGLLVGALTFLVVSLFLQLKVLVLSN